MFLERSRFTHTGASTSTLHQENRTHESGSKQRYIALNMHCIYLSNSDKSITYTPISCENTGYPLYVARFRAFEPHWQATQNKARTAIGSPRLVVSYQVRSFSTAAAPFLPGARHPAGWDRSPAPSEPSAPPGSSPRWYRPCAA
jgi:hypothetical protein